MIIIDNVSSDTFELNGIRHPKIYHPLKGGNLGIGIYNIYDTSSQLLPVTSFSDFSVNGVQYTTQAETISAMLPIIYGATSSAAEAEGSTFGGTKLYTLSLDGIDTSLPELEYIRDAVNRGRLSTVGIGTTINPSGSYIPFTNNDGQIMNFKTVTLSNDGESFNLRYYRMLKSFTSVGGANPVNEITEDDLMPDGKIAIDLQNPDLFISLGDIGVSNVWDAFNLGQPEVDGVRQPWDVNGEVFVSATQDGDDKLWIFNGGTGIWGGNNPLLITETALEGMFEILTDDVEPTEPISIPVESLASITDPTTGLIILDSDNLNVLKYYNGTDWISFESAFKLGTSQSGSIDETKKVCRSGDTSFGGDDPLHKVDVIGDFYNKELVSNIGSVVLTTGNDIAVDEGIPSGVLTGFEATFKDELTSDRSGLFVGKSNVAGVSDIIAVFGLNKGANPLVPDEYARVSAFRAKGGIEHLVLDFECKNGSNDSHKFRIRSGRWETNKVGLITAYGNGNLKEGDTYDGGANIGVVTVGQPTYFLAVTGGGTLLEIPISKIGHKSYTVANLPSGVAGDRAFATDISDPTFNELATGGGTNFVPVFHNGSNWIVG